ncbi:unnamed protein product [Adineta ricciae]|uniref:G-protein coupled receptors family 1 profile domain-containing protein n=1 Tax=Adineta ricciae TaxID=249248 RepID=A0A815V4C5_ADIRI|nr:unnamed protein product [Adineta ricciae]CAF1524491.1 unnamed protein product [Adineta ricciae]
MNISDDSANVLHRIKFYLLLTLHIPSILLYLLIFIFLATHRPQLTALINRGPIILLLINFLVAACILPLTIHFYRSNRVLPASAAYCTFWTFLQYTLNVSSEILMVIISVQRHIFILNRNLLRIRVKRILFHDIPLFFGVAYPAILYFGLVVIYPCDGTQWNFSALVCGYANCYLLDSNAFAIFDWAMHTGIPIVIIILANVMLIIRIIRQKRRLQQRVTWRKQRRMTIQLLSVAALYFIGWMPITSIAVIQQIHQSQLAAEIQSKYIVDFIYLVCLFMPLVCIGILPELKKWIQGLFRLHKRRRNTVKPTHVTNNTAR